MRKGKGVVASAMLWGFGRGYWMGVGVVRRAETSNRTGIGVWVCDVV